MSTPSIEDLRTRIQDRIKDVRERLEAKRGELLGGKRLRERFLGSGGASSPILGNVLERPILKEPLLERLRALRPLQGQKGHKASIVDRPRPGPTGMAVEGEPAYPYNTLSVIVE